MSDPSFLLVHGACHGAWCWRDLLSAMKARGLKARAIDLPGHGRDHTDYTEVSLDSYKRAILEDISKHGGPVILVGHSAGGYPITAAAQDAPDKIVQLVYLCAYVPEAGKSIADLRRAATRQPILEAIERTDDGRAFLFRRDKIADALFHDCPEDTLEYARDNLCPEAIAPQNTALTALDAAFSRPRSYILCEHDRLIPPEEQARMTAVWPEGSIHHLPSGHLPYFAMPDALADCLASLAKTDSSAPKS
nr:alpha/beta fold hydrolase [uncultured Celeribacter sp.]